MEDRLDGDAAAWFLGKVELGDYVLVGPALLQLRLRRVSGKQFMG